MDELILHLRTQRSLDLIIDNLPHGLIIDGPTGVGVSAVARLIAYHLGVQPFIILPKKRVKNELVVDLHSGNILIDDIRLLYEQTRAKQPGKHVYVIDTGEGTMTHAAQNAFLKLLEEPRQNVHFIIATHQFDQLLPTVISRSQRLSLLPVTADQTIEYINSFSISDDVKRTRLAFVGQGRPALIKRLINDDGTYDSRIDIMRDAKTVIGGNTYDRIRVIQKYRDDRPASITLLDDINHQLRTVLRSQPSRQIAQQIARHLQTRQRIVSGGNIRLQLTADML